MICSAARRARLSVPVLCILALCAAACSSGGGSGPGTARTAADLTNPFLGPEYSGWMIGAISRLASPEEIQGFQALRDDAAAASFVEQFWERRDPSPDRPGNALREAFDRRSAEADRMFSEAGYLGRRTDRGTLLILYGPPSKTDFEVSPYEGGPPVEVWTYARDGDTGLDGRRPSSLYRFLRRGDLTRLYIPGHEDTRRRPRPLSSPY